MDLPHKISQYVATVLKERMSCVCTGSFDRVMCPSISVTYSRSIWALVSTRQVKLLVQNTSKLCYGIIAIIMYLTRRRQFENRGVPKVKTLPLKWSSAFHSGCEVRCVVPSFFIFFFFAKCGVAGASVSVLLMFLPVTLPNWWCQNVLIHDRNFHAYALAKEISIFSLTTFVMLFKHNVRGLIIWFDKLFVK